MVLEIVVSSLIMIPHSSQFLQFYPPYHLMNE